MCYFGTNPMKFECAIKMKWWKMWNRPVEKYLWQFWNKSNRKWVHWESGHLWGAARSALATFWIDLHKFGQCKRLTCHTAQGIELCHVGLQCIFMMLGAVEEKLPALEGFGSPTNIYVSRGTWLGGSHLSPRQVPGLLTWDGVGQFLHCLIVPVLLFKPPSADVIILSWQKLFVFFNYLDLILNFQLSLFTAGI